MPRTQLWSPSSTAVDFRRPMPRSPHDARHSRSAPNQESDSRDLGREVFQQDLRERGSFYPAIRYPELDRLAQQRNFYKSDRHEYQLRQSEIYTMAETGKFRALSLADL